MRVCMCVCLSAAACLHYCMDPDVTWGSGRGCPLVVHYWADLQSVHRLRCYGNTRNAWQSPVVIRQAHRMPHALRMPVKAPLASDKIDAPAACATLSATRPFHFIHTVRCYNVNAKCYRVHACTRPMPSFNIFDKNVISNVCDSSCPYLVLFLVSGVYSQLFVTEVQVK